MAFYDDVTNGSSAEKQSIAKGYMDRGYSLSDKPDPNQGPMYDNEKFQKDLEAYKERQADQQADQPAGPLNFDVDEAASQTSDIEPEDLHSGGEGSFDPMQGAKVESPLLEAVVNAMPDAERTKHSEWYEYLQYKYQDEGRAAEEQRIANTLGIDPKMMFGDRALYQDMAAAAAKVEKMAKLKNLYKEDGTIDVDKVYQNIPGFDWILKNQGPMAAAMAVANMDGIAKINEVYDEGWAQFKGSIEAGAKRGALQSERNLIGAAAFNGMRYLTDKEKARIQEIDAELAQQYEMSYSNIYDVSGGMLGEAASQGSLFLYNIIAKGAALGGGLLAGAATKNPTAAMATANTAGEIASIVMMSEEMAGAHYLENLERLDKNGKQMYTPKEAAVLSGIQGGLEGVIENYTIGKYLTSVFSGGKKQITDYLTKSALAGESEAAMKEGLLKMVRGAIKDVGLTAVISDRKLMKEVAKQELLPAVNKAASGLKETALASMGEIYEETEQQLGTMVVENVFQAFTKGKDAEYYSLEEIAGETLAAGIMAIPATGGFFLAGAPIKGVMNTQRAAALRSDVNNYIHNKYFKDGVENDHRINMINNVQQALADGELDDLKNAAPETVEAILDGQNYRMGAETTMVDVKALAQTENGKEILKKLGEELGIDQEEIQDHLREEDSGMMAVKTSKLMLMQRDEGINNALKGNVAHNLAAMTDNQAKAHFEAVKEQVNTLRQLGKIDEDEVAKVISENFKTDDEKLLAEMILGSYGNDVKTGISKLKADLQAQIDDLLTYEIGKLMDEAARGTTWITNNDRDDVGAVKRVSMNYEWYKKWFKDNPRKKWSKNEARYLAEEAINGHDPYGVGFYYGADAEAQAELDQIKDQVNDLRAKLDLLNNEEYKDKLNVLTINNIMDTANLSPEAKKIFLETTNKFKSKHNADLSAAYIVNTIAYLSYADTMVKARQAAGQKNWTLKDQLAKVNFDIFGETEDRQGQQSLYQSMFGEGTYDQMDQVRAQYEGTDQWMKAPNGADTNLTEDQWLVVRTPNFKNWFGDWEAAAAVDAGKLQGTNYTVAEAEDLLKEDVAAKLAEIAEDYGIEISLVDAKIHGSRARFTAREDSDLDLVVEYSGDISEDELFNALNEDPLMFEGIQVDVNPITAADTGTLANYLARDKQYDIENGVNASKVVDENGEPMVMYHGSPFGKDFNIFDREKIGSNTELGRNAFAFTNNIEFANDFADSLPNKFNILSEYNKIIKKYCGETKSAKGLTERQLTNRKLINGGKVFLPTMSRADFADEKEYNWKTSDRTHMYDKDGSTVARWAYMNYSSSKELAEKKTIDDVIFSTILAVQKYDKEFADELRRFNPLDRQKVFSVFISTKNSKKVNIVKGERRSNYDKVMRKFTPKDNESTVVFWDNTDEVFAYVTEPTQIKSATDNNGNFDPSNPNILQQQNDPIHGNTPEEKAEFQRQYDAVVAKYKNTDQWLKAPNGQQTNLTEEQWVTVRTKNFKRWFGNWNYDPNEIVESTNLTDVVLKDLNGDPIDLTDTKAVVKLLKSRYKMINDKRQFADVKADGSRIYFSNRGFNDGASKAKTNKSGFDDTNRNLYEKLTDVIANSVYVYSKITDDRHEGKSKGLDIYYSLVNVGKQFYRVEIQANIDIDLKNTYKGHQAYKIEIEPLEYYTPAETASYTQNGSIYYGILSNLGAKVNIKDLGKTLTAEGVPIASKVLDENGEPLVVYHGTDAEFDVFDRSKTRANMDIQGNFFSPWELDASGYGSNVRAFYLNIKNPASSSVSYKALKKYQGQNYAGVKAREYLVSIGYDGVNNDDEEYIAFESTQIKSATNNNGDFDPTNPNVLAQRSLSQRDTNFLYQKGDLPKAAKKVNKQVKEANKEITVDGITSKHFALFGEREREEIVKYLNSNPVDQELKQWLAMDGLRNSPWARQTYYSILWKQAFKLLVQGVEPDFDNALVGHRDTKRCHDLIKAWAEKGDGVRGAWAYIRQSGDGFIGHPDKPINAISASFTNCRPSVGCAMFCYAANGRTNYASVLNKQELVNFLIEEYPEQAAKEIAEQYRVTDEFSKQKALRILDRGDISEKWLPFIKAMEKEGIVLQIFSKRGELLEKISKHHVRMLSIDSTNAELADRYPNLPLAIVWTGEADNALLERHRARYENYGGVVLPVKDDHGALPKEVLDKLPKWVSAENFVCPVDKGLKQVKLKIDKETGEKRTDYWNCTMCDQGFGVGCFRGKVTSKVLQELAALEQQSDQAIDDLIKRAMASMQKDFKKGGVEIDEAEQQSIYSYISSIIRNKQKANEAARTSGPFEGNTSLYQQSGISEAGSGSSAGRILPKTSRGKRSLNQRVTPRKLFQADDRELVVLHNADQRKLRKALKSGGLAMPSLAITKASIPFEGFGNITFVGTKDMIDPSKPGHPVYSRDAFTVRTPGIKFEKPSGEKIEDLLAPVETVMKDFDKFNNKGVISSDLRVLKDAAAMGVEPSWENTALQYYYLTRVKGEKVDIPDLDLWKDYFGQFGFVDDAVMKALRENEDLIMSFFHHREAVPKLLPVIKESIAKANISDLTWDAVCVRKGIIMNFGQYEDLTPEVAEEIYNELAEKVIDGYRNYKWDQSNNIERFDEIKLYDEVNIRTEDGEYAAWAKDFLDKLRGEPMIRNKDGLMVSATLDNIVEKMKEHSGPGFEFSDLFPAVVAAKGSKVFTDIEDIRQHRDLLHTEQEVEDAIDKNNNMLEMLKDTAESYYAGNKDVEQEFYQAIVDVIAGNKEATKENIEAALKNHDFTRESYILNKSGFDDEDILDFNDPTANYEFDQELQFIVETANNTKDLITQYFEAKPERPVYFNEFVGAVVPERADPEIVEKLRELGLQIETYDSDAYSWDEHVNNDRSAALNKIIQDNNVLFQDAQERYDSHQGVKGATEYQDMDDNGSFGDIMIRMFESADQSTFIHELGHVYLLELQELAMMDPNGQAAADVETVYNWAAWKADQVNEYKGTASYAEFKELDEAIRQAIRNGSAEYQGQVETLESLQDRWLQERFARGFEMYLQEGKAPTPTLKRTFRKFKAWLIKIYETLTGAGAKATPEVEAVMARAFATQETIEATAELNRINNLDLDKNLSNDELRAMHERWKEEAIEQAKERMLTKLLKVYKKDIKDKVDAFEKAKRAEITESLRDQYRCFNVDEAVAEGMPKADALELYGFQDGQQFTADQEYRQEKRLAGQGEILDLDAAVEKRLKAEVKNFKSQMPTTAQLQEMAETELANDKAADLVALEAEILKKREERYNAAGAKLMTAFDEVDKAIKGDNPAKLERKIQELKYANQWGAAELDLLNDMENALRNRDKARLRGAEKKIAGLEEKYDKLKQITLENVDWLRGIRDAAKGRSIILRDQAKADMGSLPVHEAISVGLWNRKQQKAAAEAYKKVVEGQKLKASGKTKEAQTAWDEAYKAKLEQTYYAAMTAAAAQSNKEVQKVLDRIKQRQRSLSNKGAVKLDAEARYYFDHLLYLYGFNKVDARKPLELQGFQEFWDNLTADVDDEVAIDPAFAAIMDGNELQKKYRLLTMDQFRELAKVMNVIYTLGRNKNMLLTIDISMDEVRAECRQAFGSHIGNPKEEKRFEEASKIQEYIGDYEISLLRPEVMLEIAGGNATGFHKYIYMILQKATENEAKAKEDEAIAFNELVEKYYDADERRSFDKAIDGVQLPDGSKLTKNMLLSMALNWGNKTNQARLYTCLYADEYGNLPNAERAFSETQNYLIKYMTENDWRFVQAVWDHIGSYADQVSAVVERINGVPMKRVEAQAFDILTADEKMVHLEGGYYPLVSNPRKDSTVNEQKEIEEAAAGRQSLGSGMGSTKERANSLNVNRPLLLDLSVISRHINQQIHIANMRLACRDAYKVLNDSVIKTQLQIAWGQKGYRMLNQWILDCWKPSPGPSSVLEKGAAMIRGNSVGAIMGYRVGTAILNFANPVPMINEIGAMNTLSALLTYLRNPAEIRRMVLNDSVIMRNRADNLDTDLNHVQETAFGDDNRISNSINRYANWFIAETDMLCSIPLYYWRYQDTLNKAIQNGSTAAEAAEQAHAAATKSVRNVFGSTDMVDRSEVQRAKSEFVKLFIPFFTFSNTMYNAVAKEFYKASKGGTNEAEYNDDGKLINIEYDRGDVRSRYTRAAQAALLLFVVMPMVETILREGIDQFTGSGDDDKDKDWISLFAKLGKNWTKNSISSSTGSLYGINLAVECIVRLIEGGYTSGRGSTGVIGGAAARFESVLTSLAKIIKGNGSYIDFGRNLAKAGNTIYGTPDTFSDFVFNAAQFAADYDRYNDLDAWREFIAKSIFDRKLKAKK